MSGKALKGQPIDTKREFDAVAPEARAFPPEIVAAGHGRPLAGRRDARASRALSPSKTVQSLQVMIQGTFDAYTASKALSGSPIPVPACCS